MVHTDQLAVGGIVAFISAAGRLNDPWGDLVNYFRDFSLTKVKYDPVADRVNQLSDRRAAVPIDQRTALRIEASDIAGDRCPFATSTGCSDRDPWR